MNLSGKHVIVTGANTGIGRVTAVALAREGAHIHLACRSEERTRPVIEEIQRAGGKAELLPLDLADFESVRASAKAFLARDVPLPLLVNNAGLAGARGLTKDGFELTFGTNHLGPYLFTRLLMPAIERAGEARIVNVSSRGHYRATGIARGGDAIDWDAAQKTTKSTSGFPEYCVSKLANVLFTAELAERCPEGIRAYSLHPGAVASDVWREVPWGIRHIVKLFMLTNEEGAKTTLHCALSDAAGGQNGLYYDRCKPVEASALGRDKALARELWERSASWTGLSPWAPSVLRKPAAAPQVGKSQFT